MHVAVLIAGVADTKRPLERPSSGDWRHLIATPTTPFKLSPFDEAALETALKLRDRDPATTITALVSDGAADLAFMRSIASYRIERVLGLLPPPEQRGNPAWLAAHAWQALALPDQPVDLVLLGREHGDLDDGMAAPYLAHAWGLPFASLALTASIAGEGKMQFERIAGDKDETVTLPVPACASITNDKNNRLRHPLMKNVMLAKQQKFPLIEAGVADINAGMTIAQAAPPATAMRGEAPCRMLQGAIGEQAQELADFLNTWKHSGDRHES